MVCVLLIRRNTIQTDCWPSRGQQVSRRGRTATSFTSSSTSSPFSNPNHSSPGGPSPPSRHPSPPSRNRLKSAGMPTPTPAHPPGWARKLSLTVSIMIILCDHPVNKRLSRFLLKIDASNSLPSGTISHWLIRPMEPLGMLLA